MRSPSVVARLFFIAVLSGVAGCFSLSRDTPSLEQYVLRGASTAAAAATQVPSGITLGVRRLDLAAYLATPSIVVRRGEHQIGTSDFHRWGEDPVQGISRAVASHMAASAAIRAVSVAPWPVRTDHDYLVQFHVSRFEGITDSDLPTTTGSAQVAATWEILRPADGTVLARGGADYRQQGWRVGDYAALVTMLEEGLTGVARDVVSCVQRLAAAAQPAADAMIETALACP
ncbi:PqiC family protein [soil metagenome]